MKQGRAQIPAIRVTPDAFRLMKAYAKDNDISMNEAARQLLKDSPKLKALAKDIGIDIEKAFTVSSWGGSRKESEE